MNDQMDIERNEKQLTQEVIGHDQQNNQSKNNQDNIIEEQELIIRLNDCMKCSVQVERYQVNRMIFKERD